MQISIYKKIILAYCILVSYLRKSTFICFLIIPPREAQHHVPTGYYTEGSSPSPSPPSEPLPPDEIPFALR